MHADPDPFIPIPSQSSTNTKNQQSPRSSYGVKQILKRYNSNSQITLFHNQFHQLTLKYNKSSNTQQHQQKGFMHMYDFQEAQLYYGNASDLLGAVLYYMAIWKNQLDVDVYWQVEFGQMLMLYCAQAVVADLRVKLDIQMLYLKKICNLRNRILTQNQPKQKQHQKEVTKNKESTIELTTKIPTDQNIENLCLELQRMLLKIIEKSKQSGNNDKRTKQKLIIRILCFVVNFVLNHLSWYRAQQSPIWKKNMNNQYLIGFLTEFKGAVKITTFLKDATDKYLQNLSHNMQFALPTK